LSNIGPKRASQEFNTIGVPPVTCTGVSYQTAIAADWGNLEVVDLQAAVDHGIAAGLAAPEKLGVGGCSHGGILTDALIAKDQRFQAATSRRGHCVSADAVRRGPVHDPVRRGDRAALEGRVGTVDEDLVGVPADRMERYLAWHAKYLK
jgi:hypothetical protein